MIIIFCQNNVISSGNKSICFDSLTLLFLSRTWQVVDVACFVQCLPLERGSCAAVRSWILFSIIPPRQIIKTKALLLNCLRWPKVWMFKRNLMCCHIFILWRWTAMPLINFFDEVRCRDSSIGEVDLVWSQSCAFEIICGQARLVLYSPFLV